MSKRIAFCGVFAALAIVISYFERFIPVPVPVPGIKLGLANVIILIILYYLGSKDAFGVSMIRIFVVGFLFSGMMGIMYSLAGGLLSYITMVGAKKIKIFSPVGVSVVGGVFHNVGQIVVATWVVENYKLLYYLPVLIVMGVIAGVVTGVIAMYSLSYLQKKPFSAL